MGTICVSSYANIFMSEFEEKYIYPLIRNKSVIYLHYILEKVSRLVRHSELSAYVQPSRNTGNIPKT